MKRLKLLILVFCAALSVPLAYFVARTYQGLAQEETATLRYFAETLFDEMESALAAIVIAEESRAIDEYNYTMTSVDRPTDSTDRDRSPLSHPPQKPFILGYMQNNPDGSFQTPLVEAGKTIPEKQVPTVKRLEAVNRVFNQKRVIQTDVVKPRPTTTVAQVEKKQTKGWADKYLNLPRSQESRTYLGKKEKRVEEISLQQALKFAQHDQMAVREEAPKEIKTGEGAETASSGSRFFSQRPKILNRMAAPSAPFSEAEGSAASSAPVEMDVEKTFQVEVAPLQSVFITDDQIFIFRRIMINKQIYRQGFVILVKEFLDYLADMHFSDQPMAQFTDLRLKVVERGREIVSKQAGVFANQPKFRLDRAFPSPFSFLRASLTCNDIPKSAGRDTLNVMMAVLAGIVLIGLFAIYKSARAVVDLSERRSQFVSSVTHELKTPLTNIRMYVEMLEQGIAPNHEREQDYFQILGSESERLSRLINNVLELSKLEKKQRHMNMQPGTFEEVVDSVRMVMQEKFKQEGFVLKVVQEEIVPFSYDREVMVQVLINLIENSIKFRKMHPKKEILLRILSEGGRIKGRKDKPAAGRVMITVSDTGPGIPKHALKKIFDDFYRPDNSLSRATGGTGIGLALVKKFVAAMGGSVFAANNDGPGCTITISMPSNPSPPTKCSPSGSF